MRENLSAPGTLNDWMAASENALWNAGFDNVGFDPDIDRLYGDYGASDYIDIDFSVSEPGRVRLEIKASSRSMIEKYKQSAIREIKKLKKEQAVAQTAHHLDDVNRDRPSASGRPQSPAAAASERPFSEQISERIPKDSRGVPIYAKTWFILLMLVLVPPLGIFLLFYCKKFRLPARILTAFVALMYLLLIWVGFFGVNTGFNKETVNMWYKDAQSQITRLFNKNKDQADSPQPAPDAASDEETLVNDEGVTEIPINQSGEPQKKEPGFLEKILQPFQGEASE